MTPTLHHDQDRQSLRMHEEAVRMIQSDPALMARALDILRRWDGFVSARSKPLRDQWAQIIATQNWSLALEQSERGNQLRQASPLAILLPHQVRLGIIKKVKAERSLAHAQE